MTDLLLGIFIGGVLGIIVHEAGHAAIALITGLELRAIILGQGRPLFAGKYRGIRIHVNAIPLSGSVAVFPELHQRKIPLLIFAFSGISANILLALSAVLLSASGHLPDLQQAVAGFYYVQVFLIVVNLIPQTVTYRGEPTYNDGKLILSILKIADGGLNPLAEQAYLSTLAQYAKGKDPRTIFSPASQRLMMYTYLRRTGYLDPDERKDLFWKLLDELAKGELSPEEELLVLDHLITDAVITGEPEARHYIDEWSSRAISLGPDIKTLKFSRGAALIELGRYAEGKALVEAHAGPDDRPFDSLLNNAFLARAEVALGNRE
jgi:hypothetical protein